MLAMYCCGQVIAQPPPQEHEVGAENHPEPQPCSAGPRIRKPPPLCKYPDCTRVDKGRGYCKQVCQAQALVESHVYYDHAMPSWSCFDHTLLVMTNFVNQHDEKRRRMYDTSVGQHGGGKRCGVDGCSIASRGAMGLCIKHGGGPRCRARRCIKSARTVGGYCKAVSGRQA
jgi:hypothetical protein